MHFNFLLITIPPYLFLNQILLAVATTNSPVLYHPLDNIAVNCGSYGNSIGVDGRVWIGDISSTYTPMLQSANGKLLSSKAANQPLSADTGPYRTARLSRWPFAYTFRVTPGPKFIRLHFYPASYRGGFKRSKAFFNVKVGPYTLLSNFSASLTADYLGSESLVKEYCVNVEENQPLTITFSPALGGSSDEAYAFVNGIEIVSMPSGLYHTQEGDAGPHVVSENLRFPIGKSIALEMMQRLNVGGSSISSIEDTGMFRDWSQDSNYMMEKSNVQPVTVALRIKYTTIPSYIAPQKVYQTSWSVVTDKQGNGTFNFTWTLPIDLGFRYLVRLHFCDFEYEIEESDRTKFSIFFDEHVAEAKVDIIKWSGGNRAAFYRDYVVMMEGDRMQGKHNLLIAYFPHNLEGTEHDYAILKGLEVFKLSNPDKNLAGVNPVLARALRTSDSKSRKFVYASGGNAIATVLVILLTVLNISVYKLRLWGEKVGKKSISPLVPEGLCRIFSLTEVLSMTNNFDDELVIGSGGFGNVYKGHIDDGTKTVALKRLNSKSKQGAGEFWTEIEMLSNLRHKHLVSLIGYCDERQEMILIYEYMEHGTLADHLYKHNTFGNGTICHLSWEQRMKICIGAARGLDYLHTGTQHGIIHRDVKTTNILLDKDPVAKISDFGLCKVGSTSHSHTYVSTDVKGTFGYLDPEYFLTRRLTKKSDVYAFGVVLLEVLCGRPAVDIKLEEEQRSLALWGQQCIQEEKLEQLIDPTLRDQTSPQFLKVFTEVANECLHKRPSGRPTMADVVVRLECMLLSQDHHTISSSEDDEGEREDEEDDFNVHGDSNQQNYDDENTQQNDTLPQGPVARPSTPVQFNDNIRRPKRSKKNFFQRGIAILARGMDIWSMGVPDVEIQTIATNELISKDDRRISGNRRFSALSDTNMACPDGSISPTPNLRIFTFSKLKKATRNFTPDTLLGEERFGHVYRGILDEKVTSKNSKGFIVAVKRLDYDTYQRFQYWQSAVGFSGSHSNLVKLLGHCREGKELLLVYEYMPNGCLEDHLFGRKRGSAIEPLPWDIRLKILIGAARGLAFLHTLKRPVICRDFKPSNILLDGSFNSKISDFGYADSDSLEGCVYIPIPLGGHHCEHYVAPEFVATGLLEVKSVVYSFGVVLLEMLSGLRADEADIKHLVVDARSLTSVMDSRFKGKYPPKDALQIAHLAQHCLGLYPKTRPSMKEVVDTLERVSQGHT